MDGDGTTDGTAGTIHLADGAMRTEGFGRRAALATAGGISDAIDEELAESWVFGDGGVEGGTSILTGSPCLSGRADRRTQATAVTATATAMSSASGALHPTRSDIVSFGGASAGTVFRPGSLLGRSAGATVSSASSSF